MIRRLALAMCFSALAAVPTVAQEFDLGAMNDEEKAAFGEAVRAYLLENPTLLREWINVLQDAEAQAEAALDVTLVADNATALFEDESSWIGGNMDGDITLVEFLDYRCSFCRRAHPEVIELVASDGNIRKIIKELPILGEESVEASRFAISVLQLEGDEAYKKISDRLMTHRGAFSRDALSRIADSEGLDANAVIDRMDADEVSDVIQANYDLAQRMNISGTPSFVLGDQMLRGYLPLAEMREMVEEIRTR